MDGPWPWSRAMILALICSGCTAEIPALLKAASWQQLPLKTKFIGNSFSIMSVCCVRLAKTTIFAVFRVQTRCVEEVFTTRWRHICHQVPSKWKAIPKQRNKKRQMCQWPYSSPQQWEDKHSPTHKPNVGNWQAGSEQKQSSSLYTGTITCLTFLSAILQKIKGQKSCSCML